MIKGYTLLAYQDLLMIIVVEGIDGTGKTTVSKKVADSIGFNYRHYPVDYPHWYNIVQDKQKAMALDLLSNAIDPYTNWILDRYLPSSKVYGMGHLLYNTVKNLIPPANYNILLWCDPNVAYKRMLSRGLSELDPSKDELIVYQQKYLDLGIWDIIINTTHKTTMEVYNGVKQVTDARYNNLL